jgi:sensor histidine kinase YesM
VITVATAIKLIKRWYLKQKEKERLEKEKLQADLQLLKAQIHPKFLFGALDSLYSFALTDSPGQLTSY